MTARLALSAFSALADLAGKLEAFGAAPQATAVREAIRRIRADWETWWNETLSIAEATVWGGYSQSQLRRLVRQNKIPVAPDGHIRRRHVPIQPGHELPLGLAPEPVAGADFVTNLVERRRFGSVT